MNKVLLFLLIFSLVVPTNGFCEATPADIQQTRNSNDGSGGIWIGAGIGLLVGGIYTLSSASSFESNHNNPFQYNQEDVKSKANTLRTLGIVEIILGGVCGIVGINKISVSKTTEVSINTIGSTPMVVAQHSY